MAELPLPTASSLTTWMACEGWAAQQHVRSPDPELEAKADAGTEIHAFLDAVAHGQGESQSLRPAWRTWGHEVARDFMGWLTRATNGRTMLQLHPEVTVRLGGQRPAEIVGYGLGRAYPSWPDGDRPIVGTPDLLVEHEDGITVLDYKSGMDLGEPADAWQLRFAAAAWWELSGQPTERFTVGVGHVYARPDEQQGLQERVTVVDVQTVHGWWMTLQRRLRQHALQEQRHPMAFRLVEGPWCDYCPAQETCSAKHAFLRGALAVRSDRSVADADLGDLYVNLARAEKALDLLRKRVKDEVRRRGGRVPTTAGTAVRVRPTKREEVGGAAALFVLAGIDPRLGEAVSVGVSKEKLRDVCGIIAAERQVDAGEFYEDILARLRVAGATKESHGDEIREIDGD